jgi:uncharacterized protein (TIGR02466 family)
MRRQSVGMLNECLVRPDLRIQGAQPRLLELFPIPLVMWHWPEAAENKAALIESVEKRRRASSGIVRTNVNGWHSEIDLPGWPDAAIQSLVRWIVECARRTSRLLNGDTDGDVRHWRVNGWANVNPAGGRNSLHHHAQRNWHWSACYYVHLGVIESDDTLGGALVFEEWGTGLAAAGMKGDTRRSWRHRPAEGQLLLFPSWLHHSVEPHFSTEPRMSMAFNLHGAGLERSRIWSYQPPVLWRFFPRLMRRVSALMGGADLSRHATPPGCDVRL